MEALRGSSTFGAVLSVLLAVGNYLNGSQCKGFQLEYLSKVPEVKDTIHKHSLLYHMTYGCVQEQAPCGAPGIRPFRGNRQRLDRYDDVDFADMRATLKSVGAWRVGESEAPWSD